MQQRVITLILIVGLFFSLVALGASVSSWRLPDNQQGYAPEQPIAFSHRLHAGELKLDCRFCHSNSEQSRHAGIPSSDVCMKCHQFVRASFDITQAVSSLEKEIETEKGKEAESNATILADLETELKELHELRKLTELQKLYKSLGFDLDQNFELVESAEPPHSIEWKRVHNLPDYVYFDHSAHVTVGITCQRCHGPVESFERMHQEARLSMGWCVNCHRDANENGIDGTAVHASIDCTTCHY